MSQVVDSLICRVFADRISSSFSIHFFIAYGQRVRGLAVRFEMSPPVGKSKQPLFVGNFFVAFIEFILRKLIKCLCIRLMWLAWCIKFS